MAIETEPTARRLQVLALARRGQAQMIEDRGVEATLIIPPVAGTAYDRATGTTSTAGEQSIPVQVTLGGWRTRHLGAKGLVRHRVATLPITADLEGVEITLACSLVIPSEPGRWRILEAQRHTPGIFWALRLTLT